MTSIHAGLGRSPAVSRAMTYGVSSRLFGRISTMSLAETRYDGMSTFLPLTRTCPWRTAWRAWSREVAKPAR